MTKVSMVFGAIYALALVAGAIFGLLIIPNVVAIPIILLMVACFIGIVSGEIRFHYTDKRTFIKGRWVHEQIKKGQKWNGVVFDKDKTISKVVKSEDILQCPENTVKMSVPVIMSRVFNLEYFDLQHAYGQRVFYYIIDLLQTFKEIIDILFSILFHSIMSILAGLFLMWPVRAWVMRQNAIREIKAARTKTPEAIEKAALLKLGRKRKK
jgi:hypothetical protein